MKVFVTLPLERRCWLVVLETQTYSLSRSCRHSVYVCLGPKICLNRIPLLPYMWLCSHSSFDPHGLLTCAMPRKSFWISLWFQLRHCHPHNLVGRSTFGKWCYYMWSTLVHTWLMLNASEGLLNTTSFDESVKSTLWPAWSVCGKT